MTGSNPEPMNLPALFAALRAKDGDDRKAALAEIAARDPAAATELEALLEFAGDDEDRRFELDDDGRYQPGVRMDEYEIVRLVGVGGMGEVYEARQVEPVERRVALKVMSAGVRSRTAEIRFAIERQAMAMLRHPGIARLLGGGVTPDRRPYLVAEFIDGRPLIDGCDADRLGIDDRLRIMANVCDAVHHAHLGGIVHRDLTPWNILLEPDDAGPPRPRIIDFGVAKALVELPGIDSISTFGGREPGTPAYMSPEQLEGERIGPRSDLFSLGVILHEMLVGMPPLPPEAWETDTAAARRRVWRTAGIPTPAEAAAGMDADRRAREAEARGCSVDGWRRSLRGDVAAVVRIAMALDASDRYESAAVMADDLRAVCDSRPLTALRGHRWHRLRRFGRRHRGRIMGWGSAGLVASIGLGLVIEDRVAVGRDRALATRRVQGMLEIYDLLIPTMSRLERPTERAIISTILDRLESVRRSDPEVFVPLEPDLTRRLGRSYNEVGRFVDAEAVLRREIDRLGGVGALAGADQFELYREYVAAITNQRRIEEGLPHAERLAVLAERTFGPKTGPSYIARELVAACVEWLGRQDEADSIYQRHYRDILERERTGAGFEDWPSHATTRWMYAGALVRRGERTPAEAIMRREIEEDIRHRPLEPGKLNCLRIFADHLETWGELEEALELHREVLAGRIALYGEDGHPSCIASRKRIERLEAALGPVGSPIDSPPDGPG